MKRLRKIVFTVFSTLFLVIQAPAEIIHFIFPQSKITVTQAFARVLTSFEGALKQFMPGAQIKTEVKSLTNEERISLAESKNLQFNWYLHQQFEFHVGYKNNQILGYAIQDKVPGKWGPITYALFLDPAGKVKDVIVLEYSEKRGRPVAKQRFLKQFESKTAQDDIEIYKDIRGVTGATMSSRGMTDGIRMMVNVFTKIYLEK